MKALRNSFLKRDFMLVLFKWEWPEFRIYRSWKSDVGSRMLEAGCWMSDVGSRMSGVGSWGLDNSDTSPI